MKNKIILVGGGGHCKSCIDVIEAENKYNIEGVLDVKGKVGEKVSDYFIIGTDDEIRKFSEDCRYFFITIGQIKSPDKRIKLFRELKKHNLILPTIVAPSAYVSKHSSIGEGTIIMNQAFINSGVKIGRNCIINTGAIVEHDSVIGDNCHISTGAIINGEVVVKANSFIGSGVVTHQRIEVGGNSVIGASVTLMNSVGERTFLKYREN